MSLIREIRLRVKTILPRVLAVCTVAYFVYHAVEGDRGFLTWLHLKQELAQVTVQQAEVAALRSELETRVALLRPDNLDPDLLEERARDILNYGRRDEVIILSPGRRSGSENSVGGQR